MAEDNTKLVIILEAQSKKLQNSLVQVNRNIDRFAAQTERRFEQMNARNAASFEKLNRQVTASFGGLRSAIAPLLTALGVREIAGYADAWQEATNKVNAASQVAGTQARSLEALRVGADDARQSITEYADLYSRLLRVSSQVGASEADVARATDVVAKSFKAGGASAQEQAAGLIQLGQAIGSGLLQGDELRSIRENAPLLAKAIADEFGVTISQLKQLGAEGKLTSDRIFKAILKAQPEIQQAFNSTNATISDSFKRVTNALTQYIGTADQTKGAAFALHQGLSALANDFDKFADIALKVAAVLAAAFVGRAIGGMIAGLGAAGVAVARFVAIARSAQTVGGLATAVGGLGAAAGPIGAVIGTVAAGAVGYFAEQAAEAAQRSAELTKEMEDLGYISKSASDGVDKVTASINELTAAERFRKIQQINAEIAAIKSGGTPTFLQGLFSSADSKDLTSIFDIIERANNNGLFAGGVDKEAYTQIAQIAENLREIPGYAATARTELAAIAKTNVSQGVVDLETALDRVAERLGALEGKMSVSFGNTTAIDEAKEAVAGYIEAVLAVPSKWISDEELTQLQHLDFKLRANEASVDDVRAAIDRLQALNPNFNGIAAALDPLLNKLAAVLGVAQQAKAELASLGGDNGKQLFREADYGSLGPINAGQAFLDEATRRAGLTKDQKALEDQIADVKKRLAKAGNAFLTDAQIKGIAQSELDQKASFKSGGSGSRKNDYEREIESITKRTDALNAETAAQAGLNPLVNDFGYAVAKAQAQQELLTAAQEAGIQITPAIRANIGLLADGYAQATVQAGQLEKAQDRAREKAELFADTAKSAMSGFISDLRQGKTAAEALGNALANIGDKLLDFALGSLFDTDKGNILGNIFGALGFAKGGFTGSGGKYEPAGIVHKGEYVMDAATTRRIGVGNLDKLRGYAAGGYVDEMHIPSTQSARRPSQNVHVTVGVAADSNGNLMPFVESVTTQKVAQASPAIVGASVSRANKAAPGAVAQYQSQRAGSDWRLR